MGQSNNRFVRVVDLSNKNKYNLLFDHWISLNLSRRFYKSSFMIGWLTIINSCQEDLPLRLIRCYFISCIIFLFSFKFLDLILNFVFIFPICLRNLIFFFACKDWFQTYLKDCNPFLDNRILKINYSIIKITIRIVDGILFRNSIFHNLWFVIYFDSVASPSLKSKCWITYYKRIKKLMSLFVFLSYYNWLVFLIIKK